jgi:hypothetical protein
MTASPAPLVDPGDVERALEVRIREKTRKEARPVADWGWWVEAVRRQLEKDPADVARILERERKRIEIEERVKWIAAARAPKVDPEVERRREEDLRASEASKRRARLRDLLECFGPHVQTAIRGAAEKRFRRTGETGLRAIALRAQILDECITAWVGDVA